MPASKQPLNRSAAADLAELRKLREEAESLRAEVAGLHGRLEVIEAVLSFDKAPDDTSG